MAKYRCEQYPNYLVGYIVSDSGSLPVRFERGVLETDDRDAIALVERNDWFGVFIHREDEGNEQGGEETLSPASSSSEGQKKAETRNFRQLAAKLGRMAKPMLIDFANSRGIVIPESKQTRAEIIEYLLERLR
jgi:hypothetical protein